MGPLKLTDCDVGLTIGGVEYNFTHVDSVTVSDPERKRLTRGANRGNKVGIQYTEGSKEAKEISTSVIEIPASLHTLLKKCYNDGTRMNFWAISRTDGSSKFAKNAILSQTPQQLTLDDTPESMNTTLILESFDVDDTYKE